MRDHWVRRNLRYQRNVSLSADPQDDDGSIDLWFMEAGAVQLRKTLEATDDWHTVVVKSTVVPGSTEDVITPILEEESRKTAGDDFGVGMNPEFLWEGTTVQNFLNPDIIVFGVDDDRGLVRRGRASAVVVP